MATQRPDDRGNLQVIIVNLNGNNTTLQEAMRTVHNMMRRDNHARSLPANGKTKARELTAAAEDVAADELEPTLFDPAADPIRESEEPTSSAPASSTKRNKLPMPKVLMDLDFNSSAPTFREYVSQKKPKDQFDWYMLVAAWMKDYKDVDEIGIDHVYSASRYIGADWSLPTDIGQPFRDGRRNGRGFFVKGSKNGLSKITPVGEDRVKRMGLES